MEKGKEKREEYFVTVDLRESEVDSTEKLRLSIPKYDLKNRDLWGKNKQALEDKIGIAMKNDKWNETNTLIETSHGRKMVTLEDFLVVFDRFNKMANKKQNGVGNSVDFYVQVM